MAASAGPGDLLAQAVAASAARDSQLAAVTAERDALRRELGQLKNYSSEELRALVAARGALLAHQEAEIAALDSHIASHGSLTAARDTAQTTARAAASSDEALEAAIEARKVALRSVAQLVGLDSLAATVWCQMGVCINIVAGERAGKKGTLGVAADPHDAGYALNSNKARVQLETGQSVMESIANLRPQRAAAGQATGRVLVLVGGRTSQRGAIVGEDEGEFVVEIDGSGGEIEMLAGDKFVIIA